LSPGTPDPATVRRHLLALDEALSHLETLAGLEAQQLKTDLSQRWAVERGLQIAVQNVLDIATHLVASAGHDVTDYTTSIDRLGELAVLPEALARSLRPLAGFRNALVHGYLEIDVHRLYAVLNQHLGELREFGQHVEQYLVAHPSRA
jgi:uncharacterized protein YutE (UPF0331/DUF86 family)